MDYVAQKKEGGMKMGRVNKNISFNTDDPFESKMLEYSLRLPNFSGFMKKLFQNYLQSNQQNHSLSNLIINLIPQQKVNNPNHMK